MQDLEGRGRRPDEQMMNVTKEALSRFCRFEITFTELKKMMEEANVIILGPEEKILREKILAEEPKQIEDYLLRLQEAEPDPDIDNTLGYMYYYGRCTGGVPEYDKAFACFVRGAAAGVTESRYKLADMFLYGYGTKKNPYTAYKMTESVYLQLLPRFLAGETGSEFADAALRMGNLFRDGVTPWPDPKEAYKYYLQARCAIRLRMQEHRRYGDEALEAEIREAIGQVLPESRYAERVNTVHLTGLQSLLSFGLGRRHCLQMKIDRIHETEARLTIRVLPFEYLYIEERPKLFLVVPEAHYSGMVRQVTVTASRIHRLEVPGGGDTVEFDDVRGDGFYLYGRKVAEISAEYLWKAPQEEEGPI